MYSVVQDGHVAFAVKGGETVVAPRTESHMLRQGLYSIERRLVALPRRKKSDRDH